MSKITVVVGSDAEKLRVLASWIAARESSSRRECHGVHEDLLRIATEIESISILRAEIAKLKEHALVTADGAVIGLGSSVWERTPNAGINEIRNIDRIENIDSDGIWVNGCFPNGDFECACLADCYSTESVAEDALAKMKGGGK